MSPGPRFNRTRIPRMLCLLLSLANRTFVQSCRRNAAARFSTPTTNEYQRTFRSEVALRPPRYYGTILLTAPFAARGNLLQPARQAGVSIELFFGPLPRIQRAPPPVPCGRPRFGPQLPLLPFTDKRYTIVRRSKHLRQGCLIPGIRCRSREIRIMKSSSVSRTFHPFSLSALNRRSPQCTSSRIHPHPTPEEIL